MSWFHQKVLLALLTILLFGTPMSLRAVEPVPDHLSFVSPQTRVSILEVYSSQGCSSCPPAEKWVNKFVAQPQLWQEVIPLVFHVDYWDYLGWSDPFAQMKFSLRQQNYKRAGQVKTVYTPGFVFNGREWRGWFSGKSLPTIAQRVGVMRVDIDRNYLSLKYTALIPEDFTRVDKSELEVQMALLGFGLNTAIDRGENARKTLIEEFVVLEHQNLPYADSTTKVVWPKSSVRADRYAIVVWLTKNGSLSPLQATAGYIPKGWLDADVPLSVLPPL